MMSAVYMKTLRIELVFYNKKMEKLDYFTDAYIMGRIAIFVLIALVLHLLWYLISPTRVVFDRSEAVIAPQNDLQIEYLIPRCESLYYGLFNSINTVYILCFIVVSAPVAWEIRNLAVREANDSKAIMTTIYNVVVLGAIFGLTKVVTINSIAGYELQSIIGETSVALISTMVLIPFFLPRMIDVYILKRVDVDKEALRSHTSSGMMGKVGSGSKTSSDPDSITNINNRVRTLEKELTRLKKKQRTRKNETLHLVEEEEDPTKFVQRSYKSLNNINLECFMSQSSRLYFLILIVAFIFLRF